jgi:hypothetical protein
MRDRLFQHCTQRRQKRYFGTTSGALECKVCTCDSLSIVGLRSGDGGIPTTARSIFCPGVGFCREDVGRIFRLNVSRELRCRVADPQGEILLLLLDFRKGNGEL